jgi:hypothetical protein
LLFSAVFRGFSRFFGPFLQPFAVFSLLIGVGGALQQKTGPVSKSKIHSNKTDLHISCMLCLVDEHGDDCPHLMVELLQVLQIVGGQ